jgi:hypothetical protein
VSPVKPVDSAEAFNGGAAPIGRFAKHFRGECSTINDIHLVFTQRNNGCFVEIQLFVEFFGFHFCLSS